MSDQPELQSSVKSRRRQSALISLAQKRVSIAPMVVNLDALVRVFLLDGSSKVLQMYENSTAKDVLISMRFNLDLQDISTHALFRVIGHNVRRIELHEKVTDVMKDPTNSGQEVRLLFRTWITYKNGGFDKEVFQDEERHKQANTALWLAFMEATFMCMTGKYYLTEEESLLLGCLKMQSESGDFNPSIHTTDNIKQRVALRFPNPIRDKMKALTSGTLGGSGRSDELAARVQAVYARIAGKHKIECQIEYLQCLRTWCPFYGSTFFAVQCQYDDSPLDAKSSPPVLAMNAAIGPLAIFLLTATEAPTIMRHPYRRVIKWVAHADKHIFTYWVIKPNITLSDIEKYQEDSSNSNSNNKGNNGSSGSGKSGSASSASSSSSSSSGFDPRPYCDCVYLVSPQVRELEHLVRSYVQAARDVPPVLPGAPEELRPVVEPDYEELYQNLLAARISEDGTGSSEGHSATAAATASAAPTRTAEPALNAAPRASRLSVFLSALGGSATAIEESSSNDSGGGGGARSRTKSAAEVSGSGLDAGGNGQDDDEGGQQGYGDDVAGVTNSLFKNMYAQPAGDGRRGKKGRSGSEDADGSLLRLPPVVKYAANMSELKRVAEENQFSDEEGDGGSDDDDDDVDNDGSRSSGGAGSDSDEEDTSTARRKVVAKKQSSGGSAAPSSAFRRASSLLFGAGKSSEKHESEEDDEDD